MATKTEMEKEIKELKSEIRQLRSEEKSFSTELETLTGIAYDVIMEGKDYHLVTVNYDQESKNGRVADIKNLGTSLALAVNKGKRLMVDRTLAAKNNNK